MAATVLTACGNKKNSEVSTPGQDSTQESHVTKPATKVSADGPYTENYPDGQIKIKGEIKNGTRFGTWFAYYQNGTKESESYYEDGKLNGKSATYYPNGHIRYIGYYKWNEPVGTWEFYNEDGTLATTKEYKNK